jgi:hypothetical protein
MFCACSSGAFWRAGVGQKAALRVRHVRGAAFEALGVDRVLADSAAGLTYGLHQLVDGWGQSAITPIVKRIPLQPGSGSAPPSLSTGKRGAPRSSNAAKSSWSGYLRSAKTAI